MTFNFVETDIPEPDMIPPDLAGLDLCEKCHTRPKKSYSGRGPRPKTCSECSATPSRTGGSTRVKGQNAALAAQAVAALTQVHNFMTLGLMVTQMHETAGKWSTEVNEETFKTSLYEALLLDPDLCKWICRGGVKSGKVVLLITYLMLGAAVVPTAAAELKEKKAERERKAAEEAEEPTATIPTINATPQNVWST